MMWVLMLLVLAGLGGLLVAVNAVLARKDAAGDGGRGPLPDGRGLSGGGRPVELAYESCGALLTPAEAAFYPVLAEAARAGPEACLVMCKVRLSDLVRPRKGLGRSPRQTLRNKADRKHVDFVVVRASDFGVVAAVELDDSSHQRKDRKERDGFVDGALEAAGVRVVRVKWGRGYDLEGVAGVLWGD